MYTEILGAPKLRLDDEITEARPERLAFFLPRLLETDCMDDYRQEALSFAALLRSPTTIDNALKASYRQGMEEALATFERLVHSDNGTLLIKLPAGLKGNEAFQSILGEFASEEPEEGIPYRVLSIPSGKITAAQALPYPRKPGEDDFEPLITMRIIGKNDKQASVYSSAGVVEKLPSNGTWHNFSLLTCEFRFYAED